MTKKSDNVDFPAPMLAEQVLSHAQAGREAVQDFVPLAESLEWELGQQYLRERGNKAFLSDVSPIPWVINNDGTLSRNAAEVFFASLVEAEKAGTLEDEIFVLELGIGVGLFARFFLDHFQELCRTQRQDFYDRLCYVAADRSERMLLDVLRHGVLGNHVGHYCVRVVDAMEPGELVGDLRLRGGGRSQEAGIRGQESGGRSQESVFRSQESGVRGQGNGTGQPTIQGRFDPLTPGPSPTGGRGGKFRAVFLNYLLDCLPAAVLEIDGEKVKQLCVRTCVARNVKLSDYTDMTVKQLQERAKAKDPKARQELLEVYGVFASEYDYRAVDVKNLPYGAFALEYGRRITKRLLHSYGAIQCVEKLLGMVMEDGFILINDFGQTQTTRKDEFEHQRFSLATFVGVNFPLLKAYFGDHGKYQILEAGDDRGIHTRLMARAVGMDTTVRFQQIFGKAAFEELEEPVNKARGCVQNGRFELAADYYQQALKLQPRNWVLINEISSFLTFQMRDPKAGIDMAKVALALNPTCSADLWNTLGDALFEFGRTAEARAAYSHAMAVNASDVRSRFNLAWVHTREKDYPAALEKIAEALALDKTGQHRERLLQKQTEVLALLQARNQQEYLLLINLVSKYAKKEDLTTDSADNADKGI